MKIDWSHLGTNRKCSFYYFSKSERSSIVWLCVYYKIGHEGSVHCMLIQHRYLEIEILYWLEHSISKLFGVNLHFFLLHFYPNKNIYNNVEYIQIFQMYSFVFTLASLSWMLLSFLSLILISFTVNNARWIVSNSARNVSGKCWKPILQIILDLSIFFTNEKNYEVKVEEK